MPTLQHIEGVVPDVLDDLPVPDSIFIGGGLSFFVVAKCYEALAVGGNLVVHAVTLESETILMRVWQDYGGDLARIAVNYADPVGGFHGWRPLMPVMQWHLVKLKNI